MFEKLVSTLMGSRDQAHVFHWQTKGPGSYAAHMALATYYEALPDMLDGLVEAYQGKEGLIQISGIGVLDKNCDIKNIIKYFETVCNMVSKLRKNGKLQDSWIKNDIDTIVSLLYSTKYKLQYHQ